jgi:AcrR family transcriptional regulator
MVIILGSTSAAARARRSRYAEGVRPRRTSSDPAFLTAATARLGRRVQKKLDKRERIREAAWELFTADGYEGTTTSAVAERAGIAKGTLFLYAKDKRDLLFLVMHDRLEKTVDEAFASLPRRGLLEARCMHLFRTLFAMYAEEPAIAEQFVRALPGAGVGDSERAVRALTSAFVARLAELVVDAKRTGEVDEPIDPVLAARNIFSLYFGALMAWLSGHTTLDEALDPGLRASLALQMRGLARR